MPRPEPKVEEVEALILGFSVKSSNIWTEVRTEILWWVDDDTDRPPFESFEESDWWEAFVVDWLLESCTWGDGGLTSCNLPS